jgi:hypothetical protein
VGNKKDQRLIREDIADKKFLKTKPIVPNLTEIQKEVFPGSSVQKVIPTPEELIPLKFSWSDTFVDIIGKWSWKNGERNWTEDEWKKCIKNTLDGVRGMTWGEISQKHRKHGKEKHFSYPIEEICEEAQGRLETLENIFEEHDSIFRFRVDKKKRIFGFIRAGGIFEFVWWDRKHGIYQTDEFEG